MSIRSDRLKESIFIIASEEVLQLAREHDHPHSIIAVVDTVFSSDKKSIQIIVQSQSDKKGLTSFLSPISKKIHIRISRELGLRKTPNIRFVLSKNTSPKKDILQTIQELDEQYGLSQ